MNGSGRRLNIARIAAGALSGAVLAAFVLGHSAPAAGQAKHEMRRRMFDEHGGPLKRPRREKCKKEFDEKVAACINRAIRSADLNSPDYSFYKSCPVKFRAGYRRCLEGPGRAGGNK